jgi:DNA-binding response OmpR family regulator
MIDTPYTPDLPPAHILVVDDDGAIRYSTTKTLQRVGYQVTSAANAEEALGFMSDHNFDVVLTDIRMPGLTGIELLARIKEESPDAVVILMTEYTSMNTAVEAIRLGAHDYLMKPCNNQTLRQSVQRGVERSQNLQRRRSILMSLQAQIKELIEVTYHIQKTDLIPPPSATPVAPVQSTGQPNGVMTIGAMTIFLGRYQISINDNQITLTPTEFDLLVYLAAHRGRVVPCIELVREVRGYGVDETEAREVIRPHVSNLRRKLERAGQDPELISNIRGVGYRLNDIG